MPTSLVLPLSRLSRFRTCGDSELDGAIHTFARCDRFCRAIDVVEKIKNEELPTFAVVQPCY